MAATNDGFDKAVSSITGFLSQTLEQWFGPGVQDKIIGPVTWADLGVALIPILFALIVNAVLAIVFRCQIKKADSAKHWRHYLFGGLGGPVYLLLWLGSGYLAASPFLLKFFQGDDLRFARHVANRIFGISIFIALLWLCIRLTRVVEARLQPWAEKIPGKLGFFFVPLIGRSLRVLVPLLLIIFALPFFGIPGQFESAFARGSSILIVLAIAWILFQTVNLGEETLLAQFDLKSANNLQARKIYTQARLIGRALHVVIAICTIASILMLFQEVRHIGASLLASAGIVGIIAGVAAQKTLANVIAGFQIALAQPMRIDDVVIVEGEWGNIEEITLTYVVVKIWDDRRLVLPLTYFVEKPFQNWTRATAQITGQISFWVDYSFPLDEGRKFLKSVIENHPAWDKRFWNLQATDTSERSLQLRVLATAGNSGDSWNLCCDIREKFIGFLQQNYPRCLPRLRTEFEPREIPAELNAS